MNIIKSLEEKIDRIGFWDFAVVKICLFSFTLMVAKIWPNILSLDLKVYSIIFAISYAYILYVMFGRKK